MTKALRTKSGGSRKENKTGTRIPVSGNRNIMTVSDQDPAFSYRWVNDTDDRIKMFERGGWKLVDDDHAIGDTKADSSKGVGAVISKYVGANRTSYLMKIEKEYYTEDQAAKEALIAEKERAMLVQDRNAEGRYGSVTVK